MFVPPRELAATFGQLRDFIGPAAFSAWFRSARAEIDAEGAIHITVQKDATAAWLRKYYANSLERIYAGGVFIVSVDYSAVRYWPYLIDGRWELEDDVLVIVKK